jgi:Ca2+/Na+ antiporter
MYNIEDIFKSLLIGVSAGICFLYAFQTRIPLPIWALNMYNHPWIILIVIVLIVLVSEWSDKIGALLLLVLVALLINYTIFMRKIENNISQNIDKDKEIESIKNNYFELNNPDKIYSSPSKIPYSEKANPSYKGLNDISSGPAPF